MDSTELGDPGHVIRVRVGDGHVDWIGPGTEIAKLVGRVGRVDQEPLIVLNEIGVRVARWSPCVDRDGDAMDAHSPPDCPQSIRK